MFDNPAGGDGISTFSSTKFSGTSKGKLNPKDFIFSRKQKEVRLGKVMANRLVQSKERPKATMSAP